MMASPGYLLIVDDEPFNRDMLGRRLERQGYRVELAASAADAAAAVDRELPDVILLDVQMPEVSGLELLVTLRQRWNAGQLPIIMATAKTQSEDIVGAFDLGANDYVTKPIDMPVVLARVRTQIARKHAERALADSEERYALAVRGSNDGLWDWKIETDTVYYSPRWNELLGLEAAPSVGTISVWLDLVHPDDAERVRAELDGHLVGRTAKFESEHRVRRSDGRYCWVLGRGMVVRDGGGQPVRMAGSMTDITEGKVADALTGLPNRMLFTDRLSRLIEQHARIPSFVFAVLLLDLDRFKYVNDSLGHHAGDQLLVEAAARLERCVRATDTVSRVGASTRASNATVARLGGDEFAILLSDLREAADALLVAERIVRTFTEPVMIGTQEVFASVSIGVVPSGMGHKAATEMLRDADTALYRAKDAGRGRFQVFDAEMRSAAVERLEFETSLRHAVERDEFVVFYQPIVAIDTGRIATLEALVRWQHPQRGLLAPGAFIAFAEESFLSVTLDLWVFRDVCRQMQAWTQRFGSAVSLPTVAVNLSARLLEQADLPDRLNAVALLYGVSPSSLELEITESAMMVNPKQVQRGIARCRAIGFHVSIDDFGTGYSSLAYLQSFGVDRLKIDRTFVSADAQAEPNASIISTVVTLARALGLEVVAEGVETAVQAARLRELGCDFVQGYYFAKPAGADAVGALLESIARGDDPWRHKMAEIERHVLEVA